MDSYAITKSRPSDEKLGLTSQSRRAVESIAANIAEGHGRGNPKSFLNFLWIPNSSHKELKTQSIVTGRLKYHSREDTRPHFAQCEKIGQKLFGFRRSLEHFN